MEDVFTKYFWDEKGILFFTHFRNKYAVRQIEIWKDRTIYLSLENPILDGSILYDQSLDDLEVNEKDFIAREEFENEWDKQ